MREVCRPGIVAPTTTEHSGVFSKIAELLKIGVFSFCRNKILSSYREHLTAGRRESFSVMTNAVAPLWQHFLLLLFESKAGSKAVKVSRCPYSRGHTLKIALVYLGRYGCVSPSHHGTWLEAPCTLSQIQEALVLILVLTSSWAPAITNNSRSSRNRANASQPLSCARKTDLSYNLSYHLEIGAWAR